MVKMSIVKLCKLYLLCYSCLFIHFMLYNSSYSVGGFPETSVLHMSSILMFISICQFDNA